MFNCEFENKRVLIPGGLGFLGINLSKKLLSLGAKITIVNRSISDTSVKFLKGFTNSHNAQVLKGDIRDQSTLKHMLQECDLVFNLAGKSGAALSLHQAKEDMQNNIDGHLNLLEAARSLANKPKIIFTSTRLIYGITGDKAVDEQHLPMPNSIYGLHKLAAEHYYRLYNLQHDIPTVILRLTNPYGPYQNPETQGYGIANRFIMNAVSNKTISIYGEGKQLRDYIFVEDAIDAMLLASNMKDASGQIFNIGKGSSISLLKMAQEIVSLADGCKIEHTPWPESEKKVETGHSIVNVTKAKKLLNWNAATTLKDGLKKTIQFYNQELC